MYQSLNNNDLLRRAALVCGCISAIAIIFVGQLPHDTHESQHMLAVIMWLFGFLVVILIYSCLFLTNDNKSFWRFAFNVPLLSVIILHVVQQRYGWIDYMPLTQKIVVYYMIVWFVVLAFNLHLGNLVAN